MTKKIGVEVSIKALQKAIIDLHGCKATWIESVPVKEIFEVKQFGKGLFRYSI
ncbi:MAG TPA: hypothetical protein VEM15_12510 [Thermodesulfobacteriota bacterium]|nr:hypothetical protein [Thermodesulfobacteriota bacterium]